MRLNERKQKNNMPVIKKEIKEQIKKLPPNILAEIVIKAATMEKSVYDFVYINYLNKAEGEQELFEQTKEKINALFYKNYRGFSEQLQAKNMLSECIKTVNEFTKASKNKVLEADLLVYILDEAFSYPSDFYGTCFTAFDSKVGQITKRLITLVTKKMHKDYLVEYQEKINRYLQILHTRSNHLDFIYDLPKKVKI